MPPSPAAIRPADLTPMPYGRANSKNVKNPIWEPHWDGIRTLVDVFGREVRIRDEDGDPVDGFDALREAIRAAVQADEAVLDGYLLPAPLQETTGIDTAPGLDTVPTPAELGRQFILGGGGSDKRRDALEAGQRRREALPSTSPTAFVAIDLLWLDGEALVDVPLAERKRLLDTVLVDGDIVRRTVSVRGPVEAWFAQWRAFGFREVAAKDANSRYTPGTPQKDWATAVIPRR